MKRRKAIDFLTVTLFAGILLTFMVYIGITTVFAADRGDAESERKSFNDIFYGDSVISDVVKFVNYRIFGHIDGENIIIGDDEWLFEAVDSKNGYERLLDYIGGCEYSEEELQRIAINVARREAEYNAKGMEYMLVVIPDSITVGEEYVPWYLGKQSERTRLSQVTEYLSSRGVLAFINPTEAMLAEEGAPISVNNTENSINAYGAYCIYAKIVSRFLAETGREVDRIHRDDIDFYTRITDGKGIAVSAGLEQTVKNRTVSLSDTFGDSYETVYNEKGYVLTQRLDGVEDGGECVVIECADDWDRIQLMPYFSNTFDRVYYKNTLMSEPDTSEQYGATLVVQIVHESELDLILDMR